MPALCYEGNDLKNTTFAGDVQKLPQRIYTVDSIDCHFLGIIFLILAQFSEIGKLLANILELL